MSTSNKRVRAISIVVYDPSGRERPETTYLPESEWMPDRPVNSDGISISGMSPRERKRVEEIGLEAWMDEYQSSDPKQLQTREFSSKRCALGSDCMRAENQKGAYVVRSGRYCSNACR